LLLKIIILIPVIGVVDSVHFKKVVLAMCVEPIETKAASDCTDQPSATKTAVEEGDDWFMSILGVKSFMARLNGGAGGAEQPNKQEDEDDKWFLSATGKLTKLVDDASEQLSTASGGWIASLTGRFDTSNIKAIEGAGEERSSKMSLVAWELPNLLDGVKQDLPLAWSTVRMFWENTFFW
jgi:hypothetical protein